MNKLKNNRAGVVGTIILIIVCVAAGIFAGPYFSSWIKQHTDPVKEETTTVTEFHLDDIGELATQSATETIVHTSKETREIWGISLPFTTSEFIYSYDFIVKAGYDFTGITATVDNENKTVTVKLPECKILSNELVPNSFNLYLEDESIFNNISLEENNDAIESMRNEAEEKAISQGIYDNAEENAKLLLESFIDNLLVSAGINEQYTVIFE